jgi:hypothetical protein
VPQRCGIDARDLDLPRCKFQQLAEAAIFV